MTEAFVYWIHTPNHNDITTEGYIGVSRNPARRFEEHKNWSQNPILSNAFTKYRDITHTILLKGSEDYCYEMEAKLRPTDHIGWNIMDGGGKPPNLLGRKKTEVHRRKIGENNRGKSRGVGEKNNNWGGRNARGKSWYHDPVSKHSRYFLPDTVPDGWIKGRYSRTKVIANRNKP